MPVGISMKEIKAFWNERTSAGVNAGSDDYNLKELELREVLARIPPGARVLDVGAGNGVTLIKLAKERNSQGVGIDYAEKLVDLAQEYIDKENVRDRVTVCLGRIPGLPEDLGLFDVAISERCLINITDPALQYAAFCEIKTKLKPDGMYLMFENSQQAYDESNRLRAELGVPPLKEWHALYLDETVVESWETNDFRLEEISHFTSTYYFLSRIVYARLAHDAGEEPQYDSPINRLSLELPAFGTFGPTKLWVWRKRK